MTESEVLTANRADTLWFEGRSYPTQSAAKTSTADFSLKMIAEGQELPIVLKIDYRNLESDGLAPAAWEIQPETARILVGAKSVKPAFLGYEFPDPRANSMRWAKYEAELGNGVTIRISVVDRNAEFSSMKEPRWVSADSASFDLRPSGALLGLKEQAKLRKHLSAFAKTQESSRDPKITALLETLKRYEQYVYTDLEGTIGFTSRSGDYLILTLGSNGKREIKSLLILTKVDPAKKEDRYARADRTLAEKKRYLDVIESTLRKYRLDPNNPGHLSYMRNGYQAVSFDFYPKVEFDVDFYNLGQAVTRGPSSDALMKELIKALVNL